MADIEVLENRLAILESRVNALEHVQGLDGGSAFAAWGADVKRMGQVTRQLDELADSQRTVVGLLTTLIDRTKPHE